MERKRTNKARNGVNRLPSSSIGFGPSGSKKASKGTPNGRDLFFFSVRQLLIFHLAIKEQKEAQSRKVAQKSISCYPIATVSKEKVGDLFRVSIRILFYFLLFSPLAIITEPVVQRRLRLLENLQQSLSSEREREGSSLFLGK